MKNRPLYKTCRKNNDVLLLINVPNVDTFPHLMSWINISYRVGKRQKEHKTKQRQHKDKKSKSSHKNK